MKHPAGAMFWEQLAERFGEQPMLLESNGQAWSYQAFAEQVDAFIGELETILPPGKALCAVITRNTPATILAYLACLKSRHTLLLLHPEMTDASIRDICTRFQVNILLSAADKNELMPEYELLSPEPCELHPDLAVLLSTSGSSGSPKQVRLSYRNLQANAESIADYLSISAKDRAITNLPLHYSYGLSVLNSHLVAGASCVVYDGSVLERPFWDALKNLSVTNLAGVPYTYELFNRLRFKPEGYPSLRYMTQAGGKLSPELVKTFAQKLTSAGKPFYLMYGQTEATARMSYLPPEYCESHPDSIGQSIPGGSFRLVDEHGRTINAPDQIGELVYSGANVMMGYALDYQDLAEGNTLDCLPTGDLAWRDEQGLYYLTGRIDRVRKVLGVRIDLDDLQTRMQARFGSLACVASDKQLQIFLENPPDQETVQTYVTAQLQLSPSSIILHRIERLPRTVNGKVDYQALEQWGAG